MKPIILLLAALWICSTQVFGQVAEIKEIQAIRAAESIKIDGALSEGIWSEAPIATDFIQQEPTPNVPSAFQTEVKVLYDDVNLYIGARLYDDPEGILKQLVDRDDVGNSDWFYVALDPYGNGTDGFGFLLTAAGVQFDAKLSQQGEDTDWDAVWESDLQIDNKGWSLELRIPYSAIRFPDTEVQEWRINFGRVTRREQEKSWWNAVSPNIAGFLNQSGALKGLQSIKSPVRLQATPFISFTENMVYDPAADQKSNYDGQLSGGLDVKYGINDAFTLDMTLIPDFSQVRSDDLELNLGPFELFFSENRPFFTEGTEIFSKGDLFYSRRVGGRPYYRNRLEEFIDDTETVTSAPRNVRLVNATKVSGRMNNGLGIGIFNGVERKEFATVRDSLGNERQILAHPFTNYNVVVLDHNLPNNSTISLTNTNTYRAGNAVDANATNITANIRDKKNLFQFDTEFSYARRWDETDQSGHQLFLGARKISGNWRGYIGYNEESDNYNINDLGFLFAPNERRVNFGASWRTFEPGSFYNRFGIEFNGNYQRLYAPNVELGYGGGFEAWMVFKNFWRAGVWTWFNPAGFRDYFEPRTDDFSLFWQLPANQNVGGWMRTDSRKKLQIGMDANYRTYDAEGFKRKNWSIYPTYRISDRLTVGYDIEYSDWENNFGWVADDQDTPVLGRRDQLTINNELSAQFAFTSVMNINLRVRHNWSRVAYNGYFNLEQDNKLYQREAAPGDFDETFNTFNVDLIYRWRFRPGSDIFITYKNAITSFESSSQNTYFNDLGNIFNRIQQNVLAVKIIYFLDYAEMIGGRDRDASQMDLIRY